MLGCLFQSVIVAVAIVRTPLHPYLILAKPLAHVNVFVCECMQPLLLLSAYWYYEKSG